MICQCQKVINTKILKRFCIYGYVIQEIAGTRAGNPKINIMGAASYGQFKFYYQSFHK